MVKMKIGTKYPFEYELTTDVVTHEGFLLYTVRLRNISSEALTNVEVRFFLMNAKIIAHKEDHFFGNLLPNEPETFSFLVPASENSRPYLSVRGRERKWTFHWDPEKGEVRRKQKNKVKAKIESQISKVEEEYKEKDKAFDRLCQKNKGDVEKWMTGKADDELDKESKDEARAEDKR
jgi:hypothetical protein